MLQIHFIDDDGQPLCSVPDSDRWLWTVNPEAVTCSGCRVVLAAAQAPAESPQDTSASMPPSVEADTASRTG